jgi:hypothetical protein
MKYPRDKMINIFLLFIFGLVLWQFEGLLMRTNISLEAKVLVDDYFCIGWIFIGAILLHFVVILVESPLQESNRFLAINYFITFIFYMIYLNNLENKVFSEHEFFGSIPSVRENSADFIQRIWISFQVYFSIFLMLKFIISNHNKANKINRVKQVWWVFSGVIFPAIIGFFSHVFLPFFGYEEISITSSAMTAISVFTFIGMRKTNLFNFFDKISTVEILKKLDIIMIVFDNDLNIKSTNEYTDQLLMCPSLGKMNMSDLLDYPSKIVLIESLREERNQIELESLNFVIPGDQIVYAKVSIQNILIGNSGGFFLLFGNNITEIYNIKQEINDLNKYFNYFLMESNESFFEFDPQIGEIMWNGTESKLFGEGEDKIVSSIKNIEILLEQNGQSNEFKSFIDWVQSSVNDEKSFTLNFKKSSGKKMHLIVSAKKFINKEINFYKVMGTIKDVSSKHDYITKISKRDLVLKEIIWIQSHKVRAPLANILGLARILKTEKDLDQISKEELLDALNVSAQKLDSIIKDVVFKAIEVNKM